MKSAILSVLIVNEVRLRLRRLSSLVTVLAVIALAWLIIPDPESGSTLIAIKQARVLYTSSAMALGSASMASFVFGLAGFYLVRGRIAEDLRSGTGSVIAATSMGNSLFLFGRWLGGVIYLLSLILAFLAAMLVCHLLRGEGAIEPGVYLVTYAMLMLPMVLFTVSCAILFDSFSPLMGKLGDIIFFFIWMAQIALLDKVNKSTGGQIHPYMFFDFIGTAMSMEQLKMMVNTTHLSLGTASFNSKLPTVVLPAYVWPAVLVKARLLTTGLAVLPLLPAFVLFHRFSPDRVRMVQARKRRSPLMYLNQLLLPFSRLAQPLFLLAQTLPGMASQIVADLALTVATAPAAGLALVLCPLLASLLNSAALPGFLAISVAVWGVLISDISTRDHQTITSEMTGAVPGGISRRYLRQLFASMLFGILLTGIIAIRWFSHHPLWALALLTGIVSMSAMSSLFGRLSGTPRTFLALFLFGMYVAVNASKVTAIDIFAFNGIANSQTIILQATLALGAGIGGYICNRYLAR